MPSCPSPKRRRREKIRPALLRPCHIPQVLLLIETSHPYGRGVIEGIARYAQENGPWTIRFEPCDFESMPPKRLMKELKEWHGDGIIARTVKKSQAELLWATKLPMVEVYGDPRYGVAQVQIDDAAVGRMAVDHFLERGLRHFGYFNYANPWWVESHRRKYCEALKAHGHDCHIYRAPPSPDRIRAIWRESQRPLVMQWLRSLPRPIGVYTGGDLHSARLLEICLEIKIAVPEDVAILGNYNDVVICETVRPTLSSIDLDNRRVGYESARLLDRLMAGKKPPKDILYLPPSHVVVRQSTDLMVIEDADVVQAMQFIRDFACTGIDVDRVAEAVGLSRSVLQRRFQRHLGRTPKEEIMRTRIKHATMLLENMDKTSESIAHKSGFSSLNYFKKAFRREVGMTPGAFRQMRKISRGAEVTVE